MAESAVRCGCHPSLSRATIKPGISTPHKGQDICLSSHGNQCRRVLFLGGQVSYLIHANRTHMRALLVVASSHRTYGNAMRRSTDGSDLQISRLPSPHFPRRRHLYQEYVCCLGVVSMALEWSMRLYLGMLAVHVLEKCQIRIFLVHHKLIPVIYWLDSIDDRACGLALGVCRRRRVIPALFRHESRRWGDRVIQWCTIRRCIMVRHRFS